VTRIGALAPVAAILMLGWPQLPAQAIVLHLPLCHGGVVDLPVHRDGEPGKDKSCALGCHGPLCSSRKRAGTPSV
jgi:hypothetical protein